MPEPSPSRRDFLRTSGSALGGSWIALNLPALLATADLACRAHEAGAAYQTLSAPDAAVLDAITAQIFPTDDTPGAREAGVVYFIDGALGSFMARAAPLIREGLDALQADVRARHPGTDTFDALPPEDQVAALRAIEATPFFQTVRFMTVAGMFAHPSHGGNRDRVGWQLLGFDDRHAWQPPFGHYDADYTPEDTDGPTP